MLVPRTENLTTPLPVLICIVLLGPRCLSELLTLTTTSYYCLELSFHMCDNVIKIPNTRLFRGRKEIMCVDFAHFMARREYPMSRP